MVYWSNRKQKWVAWNNMVPKLFDSEIEAIVYEDKLPEFIKTLTNSIMR